MQSSDEPIHVALMGDSTLDNLIWVGTVENSVIGQLRKKLQGSTVTNYAADGFTSSDVLNGAVPALSQAYWRKVGEPFPVSGGEPLKPLECVARLNDRQPVSHTVLSVGGNDIREILTSLQRLPATIAKLHENYGRIVQKLLATGLKLVLVMQYRPALATDADFYGVYQAMATAPGPGGGEEKLARLMQLIYAPVLQLAREHGLPVIDLPNTMDPADGRLFSHQIEPSTEGSAVIAGMIADVIAAHDFGAGASALYSRSPGGGELCVADNRIPGQAEAWRVRASTASPAPPCAVWSAAAEAQRQREERSAAAGPGPGAAPLPDAVAFLVQMGFAEGRARAALAQCGNLPAAALDVLLAQPQAE